MTAILAFMQNQWFKNPERAKRALEVAEQEGYRERWIGTMLFMGCLSGRRIKKAFGGTIDRIVWEEASRVITGSPTAKITADLTHITAAIDKWQPVVVLAFGAVAAAGVKGVSGLTKHKPMHALFGPHPAARHGTVCAELGALYLKLVATGALDVKEDS